MRNINRKSLPPHQKALSAMTGVNEHSKSAGCNPQVMAMRQWCGGLLFALLFSVIFAPSIVFAAGGFFMNSPPPGITTTDLAQIVINITNYVLGFITLLAVLYLIYGGINYLTAGGDDTGVESAKNIITQAIIGLIIVGVAYAIVVVVVNRFIRGL